MRSKIRVGMLMIAALALSLVPAGSVTARSAGAVSNCDRAQFVADVTVPDGTSFAPGTTFTKTWRLRNIGTCTWTNSYAVVFDSGDQMGGPASTSLPKRVGPGESVDLSLTLTAPNAAGHYIGFWKFKNGSGAAFGLGAMNTAWFVEINVTSGPSANSVALDFAANACAASWSSMQGALPCPGSDGDPSGSVRMVNQPALENGTTDPGAGLITEPQGIFNGDIHGEYAAFHVQAGDRFQSIVNCAFGATNCDVIFRLDYQIGSGPVNTFWSFHEKYEGLISRANVDLTPLAGQDVNFILTVLADGDPTGDRALWADPVITRTGTTPPPPSPNARNFDFGTATSPVAAGYVQVTEATAYAAGAYGWTTASNAQSVDRSSQSDPLKRDFVMSGTSAPTFKVDLPNGNYAVTVTMGDNDAAHDHMIVKANGMVMLPDVSTAAGVFAVNTFTVTASSGSLTFQFLDAGGVDSTWVVNAISIATSSQPPAACDRAQFVADLSVPDGTGFAPGQAFIKTWRLKNIGTCTWTTFYAMVFDTGAKMGGPDLVNLPQNVAPGQTVDLSVNLTAPSSGGKYRGFWRFQNANGVRFGIGSDATKSWWVDIRVSGIPVTVMPTLGPTHMPTATFPPPQGRCDRVEFLADVTIPDGTVFAPGTPFLKTWRLKNLGTCAWTTAYALVFENGDQMGGPNLVNLPQDVLPGTIADVSVNLTAPGTAGMYRGFWRLQNANGVRFGIGTAFIRTWWVEIGVSGTSLTPTPTQVATATPSATPTMVPTLTPGPSPTPTFVPIGTDTSGWNTYLNETYAFSFKFPTGSSTSGLSDTGGRINIPFAAGTNLRQKYLDISVREGVSPCRSPGTNPTVTALDVAFNGIQFLKETWSEGAMSHMGDFTAYSTAKGNACISLTFLLYSVVPEVMETPPPRFDPAAETAVFTTIMGTYQNR